MAGLEGRCEMNPIVEVFSLGRDIVGHHRSVRFVKNADPVVVYRNVGGGFDEPSRFDLRPHATVEVRHGEPTIGKLVAQAENQSLWQLVYFAIGCFGRAACNRVLVNLSVAADQKAAEEKPSGQTRQTNVPTHSNGAQSTAPRLTGRRFGKLSARSACQRQVEMSSFHAVG